MLQLETIHKTHLKPVNTTNPKYKDIEGVLFETPTNTLISYPIGKETKSYSIQRQGKGSIRSRKMITSSN